MRRFKMTLTSILPPAAGILVIFFVLYTIFSKEESIKNSWIFPAILSLAFFGFSLAAVMTEGALGFWTEHVRNLWGNQIWFDLLIAVGIGWFLIVPHAKAQGMRLLPWGILVICSGCIGFTAMVARMLYLRERSGK
jgi:hypothetical protein